MKAAIGILLVFTGLTVGYLVLAGKLPMPVPDPQTTYVQGQIKAGRYAL